jgi:LytR cell envelope-related transcriptional attenuator
MSNEQPSRPPKRSGSGASPMGSTLAIVIAIAAVVVGFLILKNIRSDDDGGATATTLPVSTTIDPLTATTFPLAPVESTTTIFQPTTAGAKVIVANSSHANGAAGQLTTALQANQFTMGEPTNGSSDEPVTKVQYLTGDVAAQAVAQSIAQLMGVTSVEPIPTPVLLEDPALLADNTVVVLLGDDKAGKTLEQMTSTDTSTTLAGETSTSGAP